MSSNVDQLGLKGDQSHHRRMQVKTTGDRCGVKPEWLTPKAYCLSVLSLTPQIQVYHQVQA